MPSLLPSRPRARLRIVAVPALLVSALVVGLVGAFSSTAAAEGSLAIGTDPIALRQPVDPGIGVLTPTADAADQGMFGPQVDWPVIPIHAAVSRGGHIISFGTPIARAEQNGMAYDDWNPAVRSGEDAHVTSSSMHDYDSFCNSLVFLDDGSLLMVGGNSSMSTMVYDPSTHAQTMGAALNEQRWYGSTLRLQDGRVLVVGGGNSYKTPSSSSAEADRVAITPEILQPSGQWDELTGATSSALFGLSDAHWWYPRVFNGQNDSVIGLSGDQLWRLDPAGTGSVRATGRLPYNPKVSGSQVMLAPDTLLVAGGGEEGNAEQSTGARDAVLVDLAGSDPVVTRTSAMHFGRNWLNLTVLPGGKVLANGGTLIGTEGGDQNSIKQAEIYDPTTGQWALGATAQRTRTYHSVSMLMPSGAVFTGGGGVPGPEDNFNAELYYPASLFTKRADGSVAWASRPTITSIAGDARYGGTIRLGLGDDRTIAAASLISLPAVTHSQNTDQRRIPLTLSQQGATVSAALPASLDTMPPSDYELTVVDRKGVPSPAQIVTIRKDGAGLVTPAAIAPPAPPAVTPSASPTASTAAPTAAPAPTSAPDPTPAPVSAPAPVPAAPAGPAQPRVGSTVSLQPATSARVRVLRVGGRALVRTVRSSSPRSARLAATWIVRAGLGNTAGRSFESADRPGTWLVAPEHGSGPLTVVRRSRSAAFAERATFQVVPGVLERDRSIRSVATGQYLRTSGSRVVIGPLPRSTSGLRTAVFVVAKGLAARR